MKKNGLIIIICFFLFNSCKRNEVDALPPVTQNGANTFGCLVNGQPWVANGGKYLGNGYKIKVIDGGYQFAYNDTLRNNIWLNGNRSDGENIQIFIRKVYKTGIYNLSNNTGYYPNTIPLNYGSYYDNVHNYATNTNYKGQVIITKADTLINAISGTFEFTCYNPNTKKTITISNGRFDFQNK